MHGSRSKIPSKNLSGSVARRDLIPALKSYFPLLFLEWNFFVWYIWMLGKYLIFFKISKYFDNGIYTHASDIHKHCKNTVSSFVPPTFPVVVMFTFPEELIEKTMI
jgi:hypothetical protein